MYASAFIFACMTVCIPTYMHLCLCMKKNICVCVCVCKPSTTISPRLCVDHDWPYGTALWRHTGTDGHILYWPYSQWSTSSCLKNSTHKPEEPVTSDNCLGTCWMKMREIIKSVLLTDNDRADSNILDKCFQAGPAPNNQYLVLHYSSLVWFTI